MTPPDLRLVVALYATSPHTPDRQVAILCTAMAEAAELAEGLVQPGERFARLEWFNLPLVVAGSVPVVLGVSGYGTVRPVAPTEPTGPPSPWSMLREGYPR